MKLQSSPIALIFFAILSTCHAHIGSVGNSPQIYCGRTLARAFALLCFDDSGFEKKSEVGTMYRAFLSPYNKEQEFHDYPWLAPHRAKNMDLPFRGKRYHGLVSECCFKACSIQELLNYC